MTSISSLGSNAWNSIASLSQRQPQKLAEKLTQTLDADGSGSLNTNELQSLMGDMSSRTGMGSSNLATELMTSSDANGDGSLDVSELEAALASMQPPPSTMAFAQSRGAQDDDVFGQVDADGSGSISNGELQSLMSEQSGVEVSEEDAQAIFSALDSDGDGALSAAEFDAARPQPAAGMPPADAASATGSETTAQASGAAPAASAGGAGAAGGASSSTTYDELDTNEDGVVSAAERLAGALKEANEAKASTSSASAEQAHSQTSDNDSNNVRNALVRAVNAAYQAASGVMEPATSTFSYAV